jgi:hypothetical protein
VLRSGDGGDGGHCGLGSPGAVLAVYGCRGRATVASGYSDSGGQPPRIPKGVEGWEEHRLLPSPG